MTLALQIKLRCADFATEFRSSNLSLGCLHLMMISINSRLICGTF